MHDGSWLAAGGLRYYECLDVEASYKALVTLSLSIGLDVPLISSQPKRRIGKLDHKEIKLGIRWKPLYVDGHHLNRPPETTLTSAWTPSRQLPFSAAAERTMSKSILGLWSAATVCTGPPREIPIRVRRPPTKLKNTAHTFLAFSFDSHPFIVWDTSRGECGQPHCPN